MTDEFAAAAIEMERLLSETKSVTLATASRDGAPLASYAPVYRDEAGRLHVYVSAMAKHYAHLKANGTASAMFIEDEATAENLFARRRLTLDCRAERILRDSPDWILSMDAMEARHGETMASLRGLVDFDLFRLAPSEGRLVLGFGRAYRVFGDGLKEIGYVGGGGHRSK